MNPRAVLLILAVGCASSCAWERTEYVDVPEFYFKAANLPERVVLEDGTVRVYRIRNRETPLARDDQGEEKKLELRIEHPDGTIELHAILPEHVLAHLMRCLQAQEYDVFYDQMLAQQTKDVMSAHGESIEEFAAYMEANRREIMKTVNRMMFGLTGRDIVLERDGGAIRCRLRPHVARDFKFTAVDMVSQDRELKLLTVR